MARITIAAASRVVESYDGDAESIWAGTTDPLEIRRRIREFDGAGPKISAMVPALLWRFFDCDIDEGGPIAVDANVRRVFRRTGLCAIGQGADEDVVIAAERVHRRSPMALDLGTWVVGRRWCRAGIADCGNCRLAARCAAATSAVTPAVRLSD